MSHHQGTVVLARGVVANKVSAGLAACSGRSMRAGTVRLELAATLAATITLLGPRAAAAYSIAGQIAYYSNAQPVGGVTVVLDGPTPQSAQTGPSGQYTFTTVAGGPWRIVPHIEGNALEGVTSLDAVYVLQQTVGLRTLDANQQLACDVTGNGMISSLDASRILQLTVGLIGQLPVRQACQSDWVFVPTVRGGATPPDPGTAGCVMGEIAVPALTGNVSGQDFAAILFGDCTGNWAPPTSSPTPTPTAATPAAANCALIQASTAAYAGSVSVDCSGSDYGKIASRGLPNHIMMNGITATNLQVPLAQEFTGGNAWRIPLTPAIAATPTSVVDGPIGIAVNGVPIFNPCKQGGCQNGDTKLLGELDICNGHAGRADDYHYHAVTPFAVSNMTLSTDATDGYQVLQFSSAISFTTTETGTDRYTNPAGTYHRGAPRPCTGSPDRGAGRVPSRHARHVVACHVPKGVPAGPRGVVPTAPSMGRCSRRIAGDRVLTQPGHRMAAWGHVCQGAAGGGGGAGAGAGLRPAAGGAPSPGSICAGAHLRA